MDNCHQRDSNNVTQRQDCEQGELRHMVEEYGDVPMKVLYDVAPTFGNFDRIDTPDGCIRHEDMQRISDILDGSNADGHFAMPAIRGDIWAAWRTADTNHNGCVDKTEFDASNMPKAWGKSMPTPQEPTDIHELANNLGEGIGGVAEGVGDVASVAGGAIGDAAGHAAAAAGDVAGDVDKQANPPDETVSGEAVVDGAEDFLQKRRRYRARTVTK